MKEKKCKKCGSLFDVKSKYCPYCGVKLSGIFWLFVLLCVIVSIVLGIVVFFNPFSEPNTKKKNIEGENTKVLSRLESEKEDRSKDWGYYSKKEAAPYGDDYAKNFSLIDYTYNIDGDLIFRVKNLNNVVVDVKAIVTFKDKDGKVLGTSNRNSTYAPILQNIAFRISKYDIPEGMESFDVTFEVPYKPLSYDLEHPKTIDHIVYNIKNDGKNFYMDVDYKNPGEASYNPYACVGYFYGDKFLNYECIFDISFETNKPFSVKFSNYYFDEKYKGFVFDNYRVFFNNI